MPPAASGDSKKPKKDGPSVARVKPELKHPRVVVVAEAMTSEYQTAGKCLKGLLAAVVTSLFILSLVALRSQMDAPTYMIDEGDNLLTISSDPREASVNKDMRPLYPQCLAQKRAAHISDADWLVTKLKQASGLSSPFQQVVYLCNLLSPSFYKELLLSYPTVDTLPAALNIAPPAVGPSGLPSVHLKASLTDLERFPASLVTPNWPDFPRALEAWRKLEKIVFNPIFEGLVWEKLKLSRKVGFREIRLHVEEEGYVEGINVGDPNKIAALVLFMPDDASLLYDYGTCLHTHLQWKMRDELGLGDCYYKLRYAPSSGFLFAVNDRSAHSVQPIGERPRREVQITWYEKPPKDGASGKKGRSGPVVTTFAAQEARAAGGAGEAEPAGGARRVQIGRRALGGAAAGEEENWGRGVAGGAPWEPEEGGVGAEGAAGAVGVARDGSRSRALLLWGQEEGAPAGGSGELRVAAS